MIEGEAPKTVTQIVQELTGSVDILAEILKGELILFRNDTEIGRMFWNPIMTSRQKQRILKAVGA